MSLGKKLFIGAGGGGTCPTDSVQPFGADSAYSRNVALYQLDGNANDTVENYNGAASNVTYSTGKFGNAAVFNGSSSYINTTIPASVFDTDTWSISLWIKHTDTNFGYFAGTTSGTTIGDGMGIGLYGDGTRFDFIVRYGISTVSRFQGGSLAINTWSNIVIVSNNNSVSFYQDGALMSAYSTTQFNQNPLNVPSFTHSQPLYIGRIGTNTNDTWGGEIDQVRIYDKALSSDEVRALYNETTSTASNTNVLGEGSGVALYSLDYDASDAGGNHNGTVSGNVEFGVDGEINWGARFDGGSSTHIEIPDSSYFSPRTNNFSASMWVKPTSGHVMSKQGEWFIRTYGGASDGYIEFKLYRSGGGSTHTRVRALYNTGITDGDWHHLVVTADYLSSYKIYLDGVEIVENAGTFSGTMQNTSNPVYIGSLFTYATERYVGDLDQVRFFKKALSQDEVDTLYAETACVYTSTTDKLNYQGTNAAYYKLDNTAEDETGNYDGTESNITYEFGRYGQAAVFNGANDIIKSSSLGAAFASQTTLSVSAWFKTPPSTSRGTIFSFSNTNAAAEDLWIGFYANYNTIAFRNSGNLQANDTGGSSIRDNNWHHVVFTADSGGTHIYVDGIELTGFSYSFGNSSTVINMPSGINQFNIGANQDSGGVEWTTDVTIDQVRIYNSALDATAVENLYNEKPETDTSNFKTVLYEGNGSSQYISNVGFQPDLVWVKKRDGVHDHKLADSVRGATKILESSTTDAEITATGSINAFEANGFNLGSDSSVNGNGNDFVAWCWKGGGDAVQNNDGTIQGANCLVSANQDAGFSIVKYAGNSTAGATIGHGLSAKPELILIKNLDSSLNWIAYDTNINSVGYLDLPDAFATSRLSWAFNSTDPTDTLITLGSNNAVNANTDDYIAYCFHSVAGYQKIGSYTGTGGTSVNTISFGFAPAFVLIKRTNTTGGWRMFDSTRDTGTRPLRINHSLRANLDGQEYDGTNDPNGYMSFTNDGISFSTTEVNGDLNANGSTYVYLAIA